MSGQLLLVTILATSPEEDIKVEY